MKLSKNIQSWKAKSMSKCTWKVSENASKIVSKSEKNRCRNATKMDMGSQRNSSKIVSKSVELSIKSSFGAVLEHFRDPLGAKMAQDASWIASGAPFGGVLGLIWLPRWPKLFQNDSNQPTWTPRWSTWLHFGRHLGSFFVS